MLSSWMIWWLLATGYTSVPTASSQPPAQKRVPPGVIAHDTWQATPPVGYPADAVRRNKKAGESLQFHDLTVTVKSVAVDSSGSAPIDVATLQLVAGSSRDERTVREGSAFNWNGRHLAIVAIYGPGELGAGLVALEVSDIASLPANIATATTAGGANMRLRIPHTITHVTLHHTGDARPLRAEEDPAQRLRNLQSWGARDRNWWDLPYHFLLDLEGDVYEGRDWRFMGETNTTYDPSGHFLISMIGNYDQQEPSAQQLAAIADLMTWALRTNNLPVDRIGGHYHYASTGCPGVHLRRYLEDGTLRRMVQERLDKAK
ncbi:MAG: N-acetylmuramoyl-L-alanine amidase [Gemmatimonadaceae bacterium]|nr:N-acetylmuramoyl-L-alanine amidase [Gemmatimonadaceae bacterium]